MTAAGMKQAGMGARGSGIVAGVDASTAPTGYESLVRKKSGQRIALRPVGTRLGPQVSLAWVSR